ncbi:AAA family ATPase, partial [Solirubrobacter ginsenosidimutans]
MPHIVEPLVGRGAEVEALETALVEARRGFVAVEVVGEPGMGKTRLLAELDARADAHGCLVLAGSASELERDLPFGVFVDALDEYLRGLDPRRLTGLDDVTRSELVHIFPGLDGEAGSDERFRLHRAARALLEELAGPKPLVLILDDLHWADSGSLELLGALLRRPPAAPLLLALAVRPRQVPERLVPALERAQRVELAELSAAEARELVGEDADTLYPTAGGNPFYLQQLARAPHRLAAGPAVPLSGVEVPRAVAAAFAGEIAQLSDCARQVLAGAAIAGDPFEPELAAIAAGVSEWDAIGALDELLQSDLVRHTDVPRRFRFRHPLVRSAVYATALGGWRLVAHERCARALEERGASALERAHHVERSARRGDAAAVAVLREAGAAAATRAPASAARLYEAAARLLGPAAPERAQVLAALGQAHMAAGEWQLAYDAVRECLAAGPPNVPMTAAAAALEHMLGRHQDAHARLQAALADLPADATREAVLLMLEIGRDGFYRMDYGAMREWAARALDAARALGDRPLIAAAAGELALAGVCGGTIAEAEAAAAEGAAMLEGMADEAVVGHLDLAVNGLAGSEVLLDHYERGGERAEWALGVAEATGQGQVLPLLFWTGTIRTMRGRLREAADILDTAIEIARVAGHEQGTVWNLFARSFTATAAGENALALTLAREAAATLRGMQRSFPSTGAGHALAAALLADDDAAGALHALLQAGGDETLAQIPAAWRAGALELQTRILLALDRGEDATAVAAHAQALAEELGLRSAGAFADRAAAAIALAGGQRGRLAQGALAGG